jgi:amino acid transporter, AAT family
MSGPEQTASVTPAPNQVLGREVGLRRQLTSRQLSMIGLGGAIGTGLFLGSAISVRVAGPGVILSYVAGAVVALLVAWALAEMAVAHPVAGSFGVWAEMYLHPWAGFAVRYSYWLCQVVAIGSEMVAAAIYCRLWLPGVPAWVWIAGFSAALVYVNASAVGNFGRFEYWFAMIKVVTIAVFLILGSALLFGVGFQPIGLVNYTAHGGFLPHGWRGVGLGTAMAIFSYLGTESIAVTAGEANHPETAVPRALRAMVGRLALFYVGGVAVLVGVMAWDQAGLAESPFVRVFQTVGIPAAAGVMNFVVLTAALSSSNTDLYLCARTIFSLSRGGYAPKVFGRLNRDGSPVAAVLISSAGMAAAVFLSLRFKETAFVQMLGAAFLGGLFVWMMIFLTHVAFRRRYQGLLTLRAPFYPWASIAGFAALAAITVSTWWVPGMKITLIAGVPWLGFITVCYLVWARANRSSVVVSRSSVAEGNASR